MGNCLVLEAEASKIKRTDTEILKHDPPLKVHQAPSPIHQSKKMQTKETSACRIKLVISKQELKEILGKEGLTLEDMMSQIQKEPRYCCKKEKERSASWKPELESILEVNDLS